MKRLSCLWLLALFTLSVPAGPPGGFDNEPPAMPPTVKVPPAPVLTPVEALKSFKIAPGFKIELAAADPLVHEPVALSFDADGRMYVAEMRGYMPDTEGKGENEPVGSIALLEDADGDGKYEKRSEFLDKLVMPRAVSAFRDGVLVAAPPNLWFCRDTNGDGKCDEKTVVSSAYGSPGNIEHTANGLLFGLDNWIYNADYTSRFRFVKGEWQTGKTDQHGQWGISQDDVGRLFFNGNSDHLRGDLVPPFLSAFPNLRAAAGCNAKIAADQTVWPIRPNPGINRAYQKKANGESVNLRDDGSLKACTAACAPHIYRGDIFPADCKGNAFVCEPGGNLVRRSIISSSGMVLSAKNAYDKAEFIASTDERFRPVNIYTGPDGALYILDLYRGILQHRMFLTGYLKTQIKQRGLAEGMGLGRIYRVTHESKAPAKMPKMSKQTPAEWAAALAHPNGWVRDTAQRLLVEKGDVSVAPALQKMVASDESPLARLHALWTLEGLGAADDATLAAALADKDEWVRMSAVKLHEPLIQPNPKAEALARVVKLAGDPSPVVQLQLACILAEVNDAQAKAALATLSASKEPRVAATAKKAADPVALKAKPGGKTEKPKED